MSSSAKRAKPKGKRAAPKKAKPEKAKSSKKPKEERPKPKKAAPKVTKAREKKEEPETPVVKTERIKLGEAPAASVEARHLDSMRMRRGRGFSFAELTSAGVPLEMARREGVAVDIRRRSVLEGNVELLKEWINAPGPSQRDDSKKQIAVAPVAKKK